MRIERDAQGDFVLEPALLMRGLSISEAELQRRMRAGEITSVVEDGEGEDRGRRRLSVRCGDTVWRAVLDGANTILSEETFDLRFRRWRAPKPHAS
ncbi:MAG: DUF6522 family protein [Aquamicrobium sp.]|uniref:DUF6522 family protein n=1 Tax=Aquamicrobium sp. TaxID=1872579 RepID=UPI00349EE559|nr:DUF6522 family protein [Aquamicrobium sp.]MCO5155713.1 DUF6522 family protein [Aquamicrobium sp.]